jgi:hypothetical protein
MEPSARPNRLTRLIEYNNAGARVIPALMKGAFVVNRKLSLMVATILGMALFATGCVAAAAAGAAAGAGTYAWASGKLTFTTSQGVRESHSATLSAFNDLDIDLTSDQTSTLGGTIRGVTPASESVIVDLEPLAADITNFDIRVGFWGNQYRESKLADAIQRHLQ